MRSRKSVKKAEAPQASPVGNLKSGKRKGVKPELELLEDRLAPAIQSVADTEWNGSLKAAQALPSGQDWQITGRISANDVDYYSFPASAGEKINASIKSLPATITPLLSIAGAGASSFSGVATPVWFLALDDPPDAGSSERQDGTIDPLNASAAIQTGAQYADPFGGYVAKVSGQASAEGLVVWRDERHAALNFNLMWGLSVSGTSGGDPTPEGVATDGASASTFVMFYSDGPGFVQFTTPDTSGHDGRTILLGDRIIGGPPVEGNVLPLFDEGSDYYSAAFGIEVRSDGSNAFRNGQQEDNFSGLVGWQVITPPLEPLVGLFDPAGHLVATGTGGLAYTPTTSGTWKLAVAHVGDNDFTGAGDGSVGQIGKYQLDLSRQLPDLSASLKWNTAQGGVDMGYANSGAPVPATTSEALYWGDASGKRLSGPIAGTTQRIAAGTAAGTYGPFHIDAAKLSTPPEGATHLLAIVDPDNTVSELDETNNAAQPLAIPTLKLTTSWHTYKRETDNSLPMIDADGGIDVVAEIGAAPLPMDTSVAVYWASGPTLDKALESLDDPVATQVVKASATGVQEPIHFTAAELGIPPEDATDLLVVIDPSHRIAADETDSLNDLSATPKDILAGPDLEHPSVTWIVNGADIYAYFTPMGGALTISQAQMLVGVDHFNWLQKVDHIPSTWAARTIVGLDRVPDLDYSKLGTTPNSGLVTYSGSPDLISSKSLAEPFLDPIVTKSADDPPDRYTRAFAVKHTPDGPYDQLVWWRNGPVPELPPQDHAQPPVPDQYYYYWREETDPTTGEGVQPQTFLFALSFHDRPAQPQDQLHRSPFAGAGADGYLGFETMLVGVNQAQPNDYIDWVGEGYGTQFMWKSNTVTDGKVITSGYVFPDVVGFGAGNSESFPETVSGGVFDVQFAPPLTVNVSGADHVKEGSLYTLTLGPPSDPTLYPITAYVVHWGDGSSDTVAATDLPDDRTLQHTYADGPNSYEVTVDLTDDLVTHQAIATRSVTVDDVPPTITLFGEDHVRADTPYSLTLGPVIDPGQDPIRQYIIHWGDGQTSVLSPNDVPPDRTLSHRYLGGPGPFTISVDLVDAESERTGGGTTLDQTFGAGGKVVTDFTYNPNEFGQGVAVLPTGDTVVLASTSTGMAFVYYRPDGSLDDRFGVGGRVAFQNVLSTSNNIAADAEGRLLVAGSLFNPDTFTNDFAVARYNPDGSLDASFGARGVAAVDIGSDDYAGAVALDARGRILVTGNSFDWNDDASMGLVRLGPDGTPDAGFGDGGVVTADFGGSSSGAGVAAAPDGSVVVLAWADSGWALLRYRDDGALDDSFGSAGRAPIGNAFSIGMSLAVDTEGRSIVGGLIYDPSTWGFYFALARYSADGTLDTSFGRDGTVVPAAGINGTWTSAAIDTQDRVLITGSVDDSAIGNGVDIATARLTSTGATDTSFGDEGKVITNFANFPRSGNEFGGGGGIASDGGSVVMASTEQGWAFVRYRAYGGVDDSFGSGGVLAYDRAILLWSGDMAVDSADRFLVPGSVSDPSTGRDSIAVARYNADGSRDLSFGTNGVAAIHTGSSGTGLAVTTDGSGHILVTGSDFDPRAVTESLVLVRLGPDGTPDAGFGDGGVVTADFGGSSSGAGVAAAPDGSVVVLAWADSGWALLRYRDDGALDDSFGSAGRVALDLPMSPSGIAVDRQGRILVAGTLYDSDGASAFALARYNPDGSPDTSFGNDGTLAVQLDSYAYVSTVALDARGHILLTGSSYDPSKGTSDIALVRLVSTGAYLAVATRQVTVDQGSAGPGNTTTTLTSSGSVSTWGQSVTFSVTVTGETSAPGRPTGIVTFLDGGVVLGTAELQAVGDLDEATFSTSTLGVGSHTITAVYSGDESFLTSASDSLSETVSKATPAVSWSDPASITYGTALSATQLDAGSPMPGTFTYTPAAGTVLHAGTGQTLSVLFTPDDTAHYSTVMRTVTITVMPAPLTITAESMSRVYGEASPTFTARYDGLVNGDAPGSLGGTLSFAGNATTAVDAGTYTISPRGLTSADYAITFADGTLTIARAALTVTAADQSRTYGEANPTLTGTVSGIQNGDAITASYSTTADKASDVGRYAVTAQAGGDRLANYTVTYIAGTLTVTPAPLTVAVDDAWRFVGQPNPTFTGAITGLRNGDVLTAAYSSAADPGSPAGFYDTAAALSGEKLGDYAVSVHKGTLEVVKPGSLSGTVFADFNDDGQVDFGEKGIAGVTIHLTGTDDLGHAVDRTLQTDGDGAYVFLNLRPGSYAITRTTQPAGYTPGTDAVGTAGGGLSTTVADQFLVQLAKGVDGLNYNYGERPAAGGSVRKGQTAGIGFWNNKNGQALILALNGGGASHELGDWLAATFPHMYGAQSANDLTGRNNAYVAALFQSDFLQKGTKLDAQVLATALSVYATNATLDSTQVAAKYGFTVSGNGLGTATFNVGSSGLAFGEAENTTLAVMDLLLATDAQATSGVLYGSDKRKRDMAIAVYSALLDAGSIS